MCRKTEKKPRRSKTLIAATAIILYCSLVLTILFGKPDWAIQAQEATSDVSISLRLYLILCRDLPFSLITIAHLLIINQYFELAFILDILCDLRAGW